MSPAMIKKSAWDSMVWSTTRRKAPSVAACNCCFKAADAFPMPRNGLSRCKSAAWTYRNGSIHQLYGLQRPEQVSRLKKTSNFAKRREVLKTLVLLRHGESIWNKENRFTGWTDVDLSAKGVEEARAAGRQMLSDGYIFDVAHTSVLKRAIRTLWLALDEMDLMWIPVQKTWRLNERHYGALQGLNKLETVQRHGEEQVKIWRRSYDIRPPALSPDDPRAPGNDPRYAHMKSGEAPLTECLK